MTRLILFATLLIAIWSGTVRGQQCSSAVCRTKFKILFISSTHTWINHGCPCKVGSCPYTGPPSWNTCGYEATNRLPVGPGGLRQETYKCTDPQPSTVDSTDCYRLAIERLVQAGWNDGKKAPYRIWKGLTGCADITEREDCGPNPSGNVCWKFTCAAVDCELPKMAVQECPKASQRAVTLMSDGFCQCMDDGSSYTDPDCYDPRLPSRGCEGTDVCLPGNQCLPREAVMLDRKLNRALEDGLDIRASGYVPDWRPAEPLSWAQSLITIFGKWTCPISYYGTGDGCDLNCGLYDPDCVDFDAERYREWFPTVTYDEWKRAGLGMFKPADFISPESEPYVGVQLVSEEQSRA